MSQEPRQVGHATRAPGGVPGGFWHAAAKRLAAAERISASPALDRDPDHDRPSLGREVLKVAAVAPMTCPGGLLTVRADANGGRFTRNQPSTILSVDGEDADLGTGRPVGTVFHGGYMARLPQLLPHPSATTFVAPDLIRGQRRQDALPAAARGPHQRLPRGGQARRQRSRSPVPPRSATNRTGWLDGTITS